MNAANYRRTEALEYLQKVAGNVAQKLGIDPPYIQHNGPNQAIVEAQQFEAISRFLDDVDAAFTAPLEAVQEIPEHYLHAERLARVGATKAEIVAALLNQESESNADTD